MSGEGGLVNLGKGNYCSNRVSTEPVWYLEQVPGVCEHGRSVMDHSKFCLKAWVGRGGYYLRSSFQISSAFFSTSGY